MRILYVIRDYDFFLPLGIAQIAAVSRDRGDENFLAVMSRENVLHRIEAISPDVIAFSSCTGEHEEYVRLGVQIKSAISSRRIFTIMGGAHATFFPSVLEEGQFDAICLGEGEHSFQELLDRLEYGERLDGIPNLWIRGHSYHGHRHLNQDLDSLPFPERELFLDRNNPPVVMNFMASRGCPFDCSYCFNHAIKEMHKGEKIVRYRSIDSVIREIQEAREVIPFRFVRFVDDAFMLRIDDRFREFCERYPRELGLPFMIFTRFDVMTEQIAKMLKTAGCVSVFMSIESASPIIRRNILNRRMTNEEITRGAKYCRDVGISVTAFTMLGLPTSTPEDDIAALDLAIEAKIDVPEFPIFQPFPGTQITKFCQDNGLIDDKAEFNFSGKSALKFPERVKNAQLNINSIGPWIVRHPRLRNAFVKFFMLFPHNWLFKRMYALYKIFIYPKHIFPVKYTFRERVKIAAKSLGIERRRRD